MKSMRYLSSPERVLAVFKEMLRQQDYRDLAVADIAAKARVGRTTFYRHFGRKLDLLAAMHRNIFEDVLADFDNLQIWLADEPPQSLVRFLTGFTQKGRFRRSMAFKLGQDMEGANRLLRHQFAQALATRLSSQLEGRALSLPLPTVVAAIVAIYCEQISLWVEDNGEITAEELAISVHRLSRACIREALID